MKKRKTAADRHRRQAKNVQIAKGQVRDANSRTIFKDPMLVCNSSAVGFTVTESAH